MQPLPLTKSCAAVNLRESLSGTTAAAASDSGTQEKLNTHGEQEKIIPHMPDKVLPTDFENFIPWSCLQWQCELFVIVIKKQRVSYVPVAGSLKKPPKGKTKARFEGDVHNIKAPSSEDKIPETILNDPSVFLIRTYYNEQDKLSEIEIINPKSVVPCQVIKAMNIAFTFHTSLTKLSIRNGGLSALVLHEVAQGLHMSTIKELCLDSSYVLEGNYYVLLDQLSQLSFLSLRRCSINDIVTYEIVSRLKENKPMSKVLQILDLSSNFITDEGAEYIADMLRSNRCILHINLAGNQITDRGAVFILNTLKEFVLTDEEVYAMRVRRIKYFQLRNEVYNEFLREECSRRLKTPSVLGSGRTATASAKRSPASSRKSIVSTKRSPILDEYEIAEMNTNKLLGQKFTDIFDDNHTIYKDDYLYCLGNFKLTSINFAYNNMEILSLKNLVKVLKYQSQVTKVPRTTGLMRLVLDGNKMAASCPELDLIEMYLKRVIVENIPVYAKRRISRDKRRT